MQTLRKPFWILLLVTLPALLLFWLFGSAYNVIGTLLNEENLHYWKLFGWWLGIMSVLFTAYGAFCLFTKRRMHPAVSIALLLGYIAFLYFYMQCSDKMLSWSIPRWMMFQGDLHLYVFAFLMPLMLYGVLLLVDWFTPDPKGSKGWVNFLVSLIFPLAWYLGVNVFSIFRAYDYDDDAARHVIVLLFICSTVLFLFFLLRAVYLLISKSPAFWSRYSLLWKIPVALLFPLLGLALNNGVIRMHEFHNNYIFGDFTSYWFYVLAVLNGLLICLPSPQDHRLRLPLYLARCVTYAYTLYFFLVFVPFFPLSIAAIIAFGLGFLMLAPLVLMLVHTKMLADDHRFLLARIKKVRLNLLTLAAVLIIPTVIAVNFYSERRNLHEALDYLYAPDLHAEQPRLDTAALANTLKNVHAFKRSRNNDFLISPGRPYIDAFYRWMVLDHLTLAGQKLALMRQVFMDDGNYNEGWQRPPLLPDSAVKIEQHAVRSEYDPQAKLWRTTLDLRIANKGARNIAEYGTTLRLPEGCWITGYYLYVGDKKKEGILAEKKAATWVYTEITRRAQDPGILRYLDDGSVEFRVFPFDSGQVRRTGIRFAHLEPLTFSIDSLNLQFGNKDVQLEEAPASAGDALLYVSSAGKKKCKRVERRPLYYFIMDLSAGKKADAYHKRIDETVARLKLSNTDYHVVAANYRSQLIGQGDWKMQLSDFPCEGGFFAEHAMRRALIYNYTKAKDRCPVLVLVTDEPENAIFTKPLNDLAFTTPDYKVYHALNSDAQLSAYAFGAEAAQPLRSTGLVDKPAGVLEYKSKAGKTFYLPADSTGSFVPTGEPAPLEALTGRKEREDALHLEAALRYERLHPEDSEENWLGLVRASFLTGLLTPHTAYIVVETEAQEKALLEKQKQTLSSKKSLDASEEQFRMSEPSLWLLLLLALLLFLARKRSLPRSGS